MLEFVDKSRAVRIYRRDSATSQRVPVATLIKSTLSLSTDSANNLSPQESEEIERVSQLYREVDSIQRRLWALQFPSIVREVMDFCETDEASSQEKKLVYLALRLAWRQAQKMGPEYGE